MPTSQQHESPTPAAIITPGLPPGVTATERITDIDFRDEYDRIGELDQEQQQQHAGTVQPGMRAAMRTEVAQKLGYICCVELLRNFADSLCATFSLDAPTMHTALHAVAHEFDPAKPTPGE